MFPMGFCSPNTGALRTYMSSKISPMSMQVKPFF